MVARRWGRRNVELVFKGYGVSVILDESVLEICCTTVCIVNNMILYTSKCFKMVDLPLNGLNTHTPSKRHKETLGDIGYAYYLDLVMVSWGVFLCPNSSKYTH